MHLILRSGLRPERLSHDANIFKTVLLRRGTVPRIAQLAQVILQPEDVTTVHAHRDMHEVFVVTSGSVIATVEGTAHRLGLGSGIVIEPGERHKIANAGPGQAVLLYFGVEPPTEPPTASP